MVGGDGGGSLHWDGIITKKVKTDESTNKKAPSTEEMEALISEGEAYIEKLRNEAINKKSGTLVTIFNNSMTENNKSITEEKRKAIIEELKPMIEAYSKAKVDEEEKQQLLLNKFESCLNNENKERLIEFVGIVDVDGMVRRSLRAVEQHRHALAMREGDHLLDRIHRAERIRHMGQPEKTCLVVEQCLEFVDQQFASIVHRDHADHCALLFCQHLPRHDVRMVFQAGQDDLVALADERAAVSVHHQVDGLCGPLRENDLPGFLRIQEMPDLNARLLVFPGGQLAQIVHRAVDVGVLFLLVAHDAVDDLLRHLAARGVIQVDQRLAGNLQLEYREVGPDLFQPGLVDRAFRSRCRNVSISFRDPVRANMVHAIKDGPAQRLDQGGHRNPVR